MAARRAAGRLGTKGAGRVAARSGDRVGARAARQSARHQGAPRQAPGAQRKRRRCPCRHARALRPRWRVARAGNRRGRHRAPGARPRRTGRRRARLRRSDRGRRLPRLHERPQRRVLRRARPACGGGARRGATRAGMGVLAHRRAPLRRESRRAFRTACATGAWRPTRSKASRRRTRRAESWSSAFAAGPRSRPPFRPPTRSCAPAKGSTGSTRSCSSGARRADGGATVTFRAPSGLLEVDVRSEPDSVARPFSCGDETGEAPLTWTLAG